MWGRPSQYHTTRAAADTAAKAPAVLVSFSLGDYLPYSRAYRFRQTNSFNDYLSALPSQPRSVCHRTPEPHNKPREVYLNIARSRAGNGKQVAACIEVRRTGSRSLRHFGYDNDILFLKIWGMCTGMAKDSGVVD